MIRDNLGKFILAVILGLGLGLILSSSLFEVRRVEIEGYGDESLKMEKIIGSNIFRLEGIELLKEEIGEDPYVEEIEVNRNLPQRVVINVNYNRPVAALQIDGKYTIFNRYLYIIAEDKEQRRYQVPVLKNIPYNFRRDRLVFPEEAELMITKLETLNPDLRHRLEEVDFSKGKIELVLSSGTEVLIGSVQELDEKLRVLNSFVEENPGLLSRLEYLDLQAPARPVIKER